MTKHAFERESVLQTLAETIDWLDTHVRDATPRSDVGASSPQEDAAPVEAGSTSRPGGN